MKQIKAGKWFDVRWSMRAPGFYIRLWRLVVMWWRLDGIEVVWRRVRAR